MTWKEFKSQVEALGVKDDDELYSIDCIALDVARSIDVEIRQIKEVDRAVFIGS